MYLKRSKCAFGLESIEYLGHKVTAAGVQPDPKKIEVIATWPVPSNVKEI